MEGLRSTAHKACTDEATYFLQTRMHLPYSDLVHTCDTSVCVSSCPFFWLQPAAEPDERLLFVDLWAGTLCSIARARGTALRARQHRHSIGRVRILLEWYSNYSYVLQIVGGIAYCIQW